MVTVTVVVLLGAEMLLQGGVANLEYTPEHVWPSIVNCSGCQGQAEGNREGRGGIHCLHDLLGCSLLQILDITRRGPKLRVLVGFSCSPLLEHGAAWYPHVVFSSRPALLFKSEGLDISHETRRKYCQKPRPTKTLKESFM